MNKISRFLTRPLLSVALWALASVFVASLLATRALAGACGALPIGLGLTLSVSEITGDLIAAFVQSFPILTKMGLDLRGTTLKLNKQEIAHITGLPTASTFNAGSGGYGYGAQSARALLTDVPVTPDQHPTCPIYWEHLNQIADDKNKYTDAINLTGYVLAKGVIDTVLAAVTTRNFSKELVIAAADMDYDGLASATTQCNSQKMMPTGRVMIVNSAVAAVLDSDSRITSKDYSGQQTGGRGIRVFKNVGGFELIQEYPDFPTNNPTALTGVTGANTGDLMTKTAHGLLTGDPVKFVSGTTFTGLTAGTKYWAIKASADTFQVASSYANAVAGTAVALSADGTDGVFQLTENLIAFAFDRRAIAILAGIPDGFNSELIAQLNIPQVMAMTPVTESESGMTMAGVSWQEVGTGKLLYTPTFIWGKGLGRQGTAASAANVITDYAGLRIVSA
jgi:hypothetical protein